MCPDDPIALRGETSSATPAAAGTAADSSPTTDSAHRHHARRAGIEHGYASGTRQRGPGTFHGQPGRLHSPAQGESLVGDAGELPGHRRQEGSIARNTHQPPVHLGHDALAGLRRRQGRWRCQLFEDELFGIDDTIERVVDYFKAAAAGSEVGRRLLLLLGPPSGGKSTLVILLKRGLEEYSHTDAGALYAIHGCPVHESPLHLVPHTLRGQFRETYGVDITRRALPALREPPRAANSAATSCRCRSSASSCPKPAACGVGTYAPHDPTTADIADLVGSVDLSKVAEFGDEGDPRAWSWSGAVFAASRGMLEMIEILKVKREFLYLLLTLTQEKNVKVSRFPLIHLDETIIAHTNLAEFRKFLQEAGERGAARPHGHHPGALHPLLQGRGAHLPQAHLLGTQAFREVHLDPHVLHVAAVFAILTRMQEGDDNEAENCRRRCASTPARTSKAWRTSEIEKIRAKHPRRRPGRRLAALRHQRAVERDHPVEREEPDHHGRADRAQGRDRVRRAHRRARRSASGSTSWSLVRKDFYNRWVKEDVHKALFVSFEQEAQQLLDKYLDEVEAMLDNRTIKDPITSEERKPDERFLRSVEEKIHISESGKQSFRQEVVRKAMGAYKRGEKFTLDSHAPLHDAVEQYLFEQRRDVLRLVSSTTRPDDETRQKISVVEKRLVDEYGYDAHSAREALNYVTTLLAQE